MPRYILRHVVVATALVGVIACTREPDRTPDMDRTADQVGDGIERAGDRAGNAIGRAGDAVQGAVESADIKAALVADESVDANAVDVDTIGDTKVVTLTGTVRTARERDRAESIATREAQGYRVDNQLIVRTN